MKLSDIKDKSLHTITCITCAVSSLIQVFVTLALCVDCLLCRSTVRVNAQHYFSVHSSHFIEMKAVARSQTYQACEPMADDGLTGCNYTCEQQVIAQQLSMGEQGTDGTLSIPTSS